MPFWAKKPVGLKSSSAFSLQKEKNESTNESKILEKEAIEWNILNFASWNKKLDCPSLWLNVFSRSESWISVLILHFGVMWKLEWYLLWYCIALHSKMNSALGLIKQKIPSIRVYLLSIVESAVSFENNIFFRTCFRGKASRTLC